MANAYAALASAYVWKFEDEGKQEHLKKASDYLNQAKQKGGKGEDPELQKKIQNLSQKLNRETA